MYILIFFRYSGAVKVQEDCRMNFKARVRLSKMLSRWLTDSGYSQREGARILRVSSTALRNWIACETEMKWEPFFSFAKILGKHPQDLFAEVFGLTARPLPERPSYEDIETAVLDSLGFAEKRRLLGVLFDELNEKCA